ncbi:MAG: radical SAM protein [Myxococcota bacterium]|nr:radical SAM protein [Myxococcota bacterium]
MKRIAIIDLSYMPPGIEQGWKATGFLERVARLSDLSIMWNPGNVAQTAGKALSTSRMDVLAQMVEQHGGDCIVHISADQHFLDPQVSNGALSLIDEGRWDYVSQWEHCRLPVGVGVRAMSAPALMGMRVSSPLAAIREMISQPTTYRLRLDDSKYCNYFESLTNACVDHETAQMFAQEGVLFGLEGALALAKAHRLERWQPKRARQYCDERGLQATVGFESTDNAKFPGYVMFDVIDTCNSECIHCPHATTMAKRGGKRKCLPLSVFKRTIDQCADQPVRFIRVTADGEPMLHPDLMEMLGYAASNVDAPVGLTTNGSLLDEAAAEALIASGTAIVDVSIDAAHASTYEKIRRGLPFHRVVGNVERLVKMRDATSARLKIMVSFVRQALNHDEQVAFEQYWKPRVDKVLIRELTSNVNLVDTGGHPDISHPRWPCPHWFRRLVINYDGMIKACPIDWENRTVLASLDDTSLFDAWHGDAYWRHRIAHLNNTFSKEMLCAGCSDWATSPWDLGYEKVVGKLTLRQGDKK